MSYIANNKRHSWYRDAILTQFKKLEVLERIMVDWEKNNIHPNDWQRLSGRGKIFESNLIRVLGLMQDIGQYGRKGKDYLTKEEMLEMNILFKTYGGKHKTMDAYNGSA